MMRKRTLFFVSCLLFIFALEPINRAAAQVIKTNKDKVLTIAVQGKIAPAAPERSYITTWDGKPKMAIGIGGRYKQDVPATALV